MAIWVVNCALNELFSRPLSIHIFFYNIFNYLLTKFIKKTNILKIFIEKNYTSYMFLFVFIY